jgi:hypothetical protein
METHAYRPAATDTFPTTPNSYLENAYTTHIFKSVDNTPGNDIILSAHPNGIAFITLASSHAAFNTITTTASLTDLPTGDASTLLEDAFLAFDVGFQQPGTASTTTATGKSLLDAQFNKGRGPYIQPNQPLCRLFLVNNTTEMPNTESIPPVIMPGATIDTTTTTEQKTREFLVTLPKVKGILVEINKKIVDLRGTALLDVLRDEYIAIIELKPVEIEKLKEIAAAAAAVGEATASAPP